MENVQIKDLMDHVWPAPNYFIRIIIALANNRLIIAPVYSTKSKSLNRIGNLKFVII